MARVTVCIVCYNTKYEILIKCIESIEKQSSEWKGIFVDHSPHSDYKQTLTNRKNWKYFERGYVNNGFGGGNNFGFENSEAADYFLLVNPDLILGKDSIRNLIRSIENRSNAGLVTGKIFYPNGNLQKLNKRNPRVLALFGRRFSIFEKIPLVKKTIEDYEMSDMDYDKENNVEFVSGCLMLIKANVWKEINGFDPRYFLYFEDADLTRKIREKGYETIYSPDAEAIHEYQRGSHKSIRHFLYFLKSMITYFQKWGWKWK
ncbi:glycosyltransferase family 2 protein [Leptospira sp. 'Mane']|uniref:glycosyltransferase family 2 protein n=1 Tax=Leptospira sp. 'Mane' TaxID=3387407 RepID=UPI00398B01DE